MSRVRPPERRQLTVMLCDLVGSSALSLRLDAEELADVIHAYRQRCATVITRHGGTVAQFVGDGVVAYFGYPRAHEDDAERAIRAALAIAAEERSSSQLAGVHVGIATGMVVVGDFADDVRPRDSNGDPQGRAQISAVGSAPNLAARLQSLADPGAVVVSEQTRRLARGIFEYTDLGSHDLKGFDEPVQAWEVVGERRVRSRFHALRTSVLTPLVNRRSELDELRQLWESARAGQGRALHLSSDPGVGKSRLAYEVSRRIVDRRCLRLWYYCSPHLQSSPLAPVIRQLWSAALFSEQDDDRTKLRKLESFVQNAAADDGETMPLLASLLSIGYEASYPPLSMSPQRQKFRLFQVFLHLLETAAARAPVLMVVEDLHWVDPSTDELIGLIIDRSKELPILAIFTARPEFHSHWNDRAHLLHMHLRTLDRPDSIEMIELLCRDRSVPEGTIAQIADRADGLPLFIEDLAKDVIEVAELHAREGGGGPERGRSIPAIPATLTASLLSRLDRLGSAKTVAQIGAVIGREFSYQLLARVAELPEDDLRDELRRLVEAGLLTSRPATAVLVYVFKHALVRDAAYSSLLRKEQVSLHSRIARVLVSDFSETAELQPEVLAYHFEAGGDVENAVQYRVAAAKLSARRSGFVEAIGLLHGALRLLETQARSSGRVRLELRVHLALGGVYAEYRGFSSSECGQAYATALDLCRELGDAPEIFIVLSGVGSFEITRGNLPKCRELAEECLARAARQHARPPFIMGHLLLGGTSFLAAEFTSAREHLEEALRLYHDERRTPHQRRQVLYVQDQKSTGLCYLALTLTIQGHLESGLRAALEGLRHSQALGGLHTINFSLCYLAGVHLLRQEAREARQRATESLELAREQGFATWRGASQMIRGGALIAEGRHTEGFEDIVAGMSAHSGMDAITYQQLGMALFARGLIARGRLDEALRVMNQACEASDRTGERFYLTEVLRLKGEIFASKGQPLEAEHWLREALELARGQGARTFELRSAVSLCQLLDESRRTAALRDVLEPVYRWFEDGVESEDLRSARALLGTRPGIV